MFAMSIPEKHRGIEWSSEDIITLKKEYRKGTLIEEIVLIIGRTKDAVQHKLKDLDLSNRRNDWADVEITTLIKLRKTGLSFPEIGKRMGRSDRSVQAKYIRVMNPEPKIQKKERKPRNNRRVYNVDDNYFSDINTQKKAYYLGFLLADGYIGKRINASRGSYNLNKIGMKLASKDIDVLEDFKAETKAEAPIKKRAARTSYYKGQAINGTESCSINVSSKKMQEDVERYGIVEKKTYVCDFPYLLHDDYYPGFIAGVMSGDGSVGVRKTHGGTSEYMRSTFAGTGKLLNGIRDVLIDYIDYSKDKSIRKYKNCKSLYSLELNHHETLRLYTWFKENGTGLMPRKTKIIEDFIKDYPEKYKRVS